MAKILSKVHTSVVYGGQQRKNTAEARQAPVYTLFDLPRVTIAPGLNTVADADVKALKAPLDVNKPGDVQFQRHLEKGLLVEVEDAAAPVVEKPKPDPRARRDKESDKAYAARMSKLDDEDAAADEQAGKDAKFLSDYDAMSADEKTAVYETLDAREKALVDGPRA